MFQVQAGRKYGQTADWWSYGVILYEMISGFTPFGNNAEEENDVFRDILHRKIRSGRKSLYKIYFYAQLNQKKLEQTYSILLTDILELSGGQAEN